MYHKLPQSHAIYDKVNPPINVLFLLSTLYYKRLILPLKIYEPPSNKCHFTEAVASIKNIPVTVTFGMKSMKINTYTKISLSKNRKSMPRILVPLKYFILYRYFILYFGVGNFNRNFIRPNSNVSGLSLETFGTF